MNASDDDTPIVNDDELADVFRSDHADLRETLESTTSDPTDVAKLLSRLHTTRQGDEQWEYVLKQAIDIAGLTSVFPGLFNFICICALEALDDHGPGAFPKKVVIWREGGDRTVSYTARQCRGLLANGFLGNVLDSTQGLKWVSKHGGINFAEMYCAPRERKEGTHKIACLLSYFNAGYSAAQNGTGSDDDLRLVTVCRRSSVAEETQNDLNNFKDSTLKVDVAVEAENIELHGSTMEAIEVADAFVNFANSTFGFGQFINSCTQEEVLQVCCPEFNVGMLHQGAMGTSEVVKVHGVRRWSTYSGYLETFKYTGPWCDTPKVQTILTMDATTHHHFDSEKVWRDTLKAYLCFQGCNHVSTGKWGCGAFKGTPSHKFAQQIVAASLAGTKLSFSTFGRNDECDIVLRALANVKPTVGKMMQTLLAASKDHIVGSGSFAMLFAQYLGD